MSQATRPNDRHIIWSNQNLDVDDWREDYKEFLEANELDDDPNDEQALYEWMEETNYDYLSDERVNLNVQLSQPIIVIGNIGRWNGRAMGYKDIPSGNIRDCLYADTDYTEWYVDKYGDLRADATHHDGTNHYLYRVFKDGVSETQMENLRDKIYHGKATRADITRLTRRLGDILILQKRDRIVDIEPDWVQLGTDENGILMNRYFVEHPEMILGEMKMVSGRFGPEATCVPYEGADLAEQLSEAVSNIHGELTVYEVEDELAEEDNSIPADPTVRNFSYTVLDDKIYFRENSRMAPVEVSATAENRIKGMIRIRDSVRKLIELQTEDYPDSEIKAEQERLNALYDTFSKQYGLINSRANISAFSQDSSFSLLSALEVLGDEGQLERKADIFYKRTIKPHTPVTSVDTASEALAVSMGEKARVDMDYMCELTGKTEEEIFADLKGVIFLNPMYGYGNSTQAKYLMADEYLSGNVREKLAFARRSAQLYPDDYTVNVEALERVQPKDLTASEIAVRLGATWLPTEIVEQFMFEFLGTPRYAQWNIKVHFSAYTGEWNIEGKSYDRSNVKAYSTYGTGRINAYKIIEETLNLKDVRIFDYVEDADGKKKAILNKKETAIAQAKQELIKQGFQDWVWSDPERRERLCRLYNDKFNSLRPREYDGSHIVFSGMNPEIELREHQRNAVAHILYGGNTLLAHAVGAGKTFEMVSAAMESKRLGLCSKSLFVVPNHLTEQWASEFLQLYPSANILVATKKDFEAKNRKSSAAELPPAITMPSLSGIRSSRKYRCPLNGSGRSSNSSLMR